VQTLVEINGNFSYGEPKSRNSRRLVSLPPTLVDLLSGHLTQRPFAPEDLLFTSPTGEPLSRSNFYSRVWKPTTRAAGLIPAPRFHDLRHTHVALLIAANVPIKAIQLRLGHASIVMTMDRYGHLMETVDESLLDALELQLARPHVGR
jgi:integrase